MVGASDILSATFEWSHRRPGLVWCLSTTGHIPPVDFHVSALLKSTTNRAHGINAPVRHDGNIYTRGFREDVRSMSMGFSYSSTAVPLTAKSCKYCGTD